MTITSLETDIQRTETSISQTVPKFESETKTTF